MKTKLNFKLAFDLHLAIWDIYRSRSIQIDGENYNASIFSMLNPVALEIISSETPIFFRFRAVSSLPSARPSSFAFCTSLLFCKFQRHEIIPVHFDAFVILHPLLFESEAISTIFSNFSKTDLRALNGNLFNVSIFFST